MIDNNDNFLKERDFRAHTYIGQTTSVCPECLSLVRAKIFIRDGKVFFGKFCAEHGHSNALVCEDAAYYLDAQKYAKPGSIPHNFAAEVNHGCPEDCGLCPDHEQHCCHPIVEVTDKCNLACPVCIGDNKDTGFISTVEFGDIVDNLVKTEGRLENITLSGGEPSLHPGFWELVSIAERPEVSRVSLVTNGLKIADDERFCEELKRRNVYVILQFDGFDEEVYKKLRGRPLLEAKKCALANLEKHGIATQLVFVAARGINEHQLGEAVKLMLEKEFVLSLAFQPVALIGRGGRTFEQDPLDRITITGVINALAEQTGGLFRREDFFPLPCPNPHCVSLTYMLKLDDGAYVPFTRFTDMKKHLHLLGQSATLGPGRETEEAIREIINDLWSTAGEVPDSDRIVKALRRAALEMFDTSGRDWQENVRASERQAKSIFIHHYMDAHNFDLARVVKCCHHYPRPGRRIMPMCAFNLFHRRKEEAPFEA